MGNIAFVTILTVVAYKICKIYEIKKQQKNWKSAGGYYIIGIQKYIEVSQEDKNVCYK